MARVGRVRSCRIGARSGGWRKIAAVPTDKEREKTFLDGSIAKREDHDTAPLDGLDGEKNYIFFVRESKDELIFRNSLLRKCSSTPRASRG